MDIEAVGRRPGPGAAVVVVGVRPAPGPDAPVVVDDADVALVAKWGVDLRRRLARAKAAGSRGEVVWIDLERDAPLAVAALGIGSGSPGDLRRAAAVLARRLRGQPDVLVRATGEVDDAGLRAFVEGLLLGSASPTWARTPPPEPPARVRIVAADLASGRRAVAAGLLHGRSTMEARRLVHTPPNLKGPGWLADRAVEIATAAGVTARVRDEADLAAEGFGGLLAVGAGSDRPPRLVTLEWAPPRRDRRGRHVVLVGKGITFDSGGLSLKPPDAQPLMKTDMAGAAAVCAALGALPQLGLRGLRVTGLLCLAENLPGARATRPGDVVTHHGGLTSEVVNTDAEGRLVLGDALHHAVADLGADVVVDVATLTGAATLALGRRYAALYSTSDALAGALSEAGDAAGEQLWRMPLHDAYADLIRSEVADQANSDRTGPGPGSITAALFLRRFVGSTPWAHLDIAGPGRSEAERDELPKGGTGFGARLLLRWLEAGAPA